MFKLVSYIRKAHTLKNFIITMAYVLQQVMHSNVAHNFLSFFLPIHVSYKSMAISITNKSYYRLVHSCHKITATKTFIYLAINNCSSPELFNTELD